jgi:hypothetical protein
VTVTSIQKLRDESRSLADRLKKDGEDEEDAISECTTASGSSSDSASEATEDDDESEVDVDDEVSCFSDHVNDVLGDLWTSHMENSEPGIVRAMHQLAMDCKSSDWRRQILYSGGHSQVLHILGEHHGSNGACRAAFCAILALCVSYSARALVGTSVTGIDSIVSGMRHHPEDPFLQTTGCGILVQLVSPKNEADRYSAASRMLVGSTSDRQSTAAAELSKTLVVSNGAIHVVLDAMKQFSSTSPRLCRYACLLFVKLAKNNEYRKDQLIAGGAIPVVLGVVRKYRGKECEAVRQAKFLSRLLIHEQEADEVNDGDATSYYYEI